MYLEKNSFSSAGDQTQSNPWYTSACNEASPPATFFEVHKPQERTVVPGVGQVCYLLGMESEEQCEKV